MRLVMSSLVLVTIHASVALAAPQVFVDDFMAATTHNGAAHRLTCPIPEGTGAATNWTVYDILGGSVDYERAISSGGQFRLSNWQYGNPFIPGVGRFTVAVIGRVALGNCLGEAATAETNMPFTDDNLCVHGGFKWNRFQLTQFGLGDTIGWGAQYGPDGQPGLAGFDDDGDGTTDNEPNCDLGPDGLPGDQNGLDDDANGLTDDPPEGGCNVGASVPGGTSNGTDDMFVISGKPSSEYLFGGADGLPGVGGLDDDGNGLVDISDVPGVFGIDDDRDGVTDEAGEMQFDQDEIGLGDDTDDIAGLQGMFLGMRGDAGTGSIGIGVFMDPQSAVDQFALSQTVSFAATRLEANNEIGIGFYTAGTRYSFSLCASGSCYGATLWVGDNVGNPVETVGPVVNTDFLNKAVFKDVAWGTVQIFNGYYTTLQNMTLLTNQTYDNKFWVLEGGILPTVPADRDADGDVDGIDFTTFASCFNKSGNPPRTLGCSPGDASAFDADGDGDVDGIDFTVFASCFNKSGNAPRALGCIPLPPSTCVGS